MALNNLNDLYVEQLRDLYNAEGQLLEALPKMAAAASSSTLREAFNTHLKETQHQRERLDEIFKELGIPATGETCAAMQGLVKEAEKTLKQPGDPDTKDAALIACAQRVEHYEIAGYGTVKTLAKRLGHRHQASLLDDILDEESHTDKLLTKIATGGMTGTGVNAKAAAKG